MIQAVPLRRLLPLAFLALCAAPAAAQSAPVPARNELGRIPILEYHLIGPKDTRWTRSPARFLNDLEFLYARGYRPISVAQLIDRRIDLAAGLSPVVFTFDDASPGQFRYVEKNGRLEIDPNSAVGIWMAFNRKHPDWGRHATFCVLSAGEAGHSFFGDKGIEGQKTEWRLRKVKFLADQGFELCGHTLWHANLSKYGDTTVQEEIARGLMAIDSAVAGYHVRTFALPFGIWPRNKALAWKGSWQNPRGSPPVEYDFDAVLTVSGPPAPSPYSPDFNARHLPRIQVFGDALERAINSLETKGQRYISAGESRKAAAAPAR